MKAFNTRFSKELWYPEYVALKEAHRKAMLLREGDYASWSDLLSVLKWTDFQLTDSIQFMTLKGLVKVFDHKQGLRCDGNGFDNKSDYQLLLLDFAE